MKYIVVLAAALAVASSQEIINQLQSTLAKMSFPEEKVAKLTEIITKTAKDCLVQSAEGVAPEQSQSVVEFAMPAIHECADKAKEIPADQADRRKIMLKACMAEKLAKSALDDAQIAFLKKMKACFMAAKGSPQ